MEVEHACRFTSLGLMDLCRLDMYVIVEHFLVLQVCDLASWGVVRKLTHIASVRADIAALGSKELSNA